MTPQQQELLDFIRERIEATGCAPTYTEMTAHFRWKSRASAHRLVTALVGLGVLKRDPSRRDNNLSLPGRPNLTGVASGILIAEVLRRGDLDKPVAVARFTAEDALQLAIFGDAPMRFLIVDERCPSDRVFEITTRLPIEMLDELVPPDTIVGNKDEPRHAALVGQVKAAEAFKPYLRAVE